MLACDWRESAVCVMIDTSRANKERRESLTIRTVSEMA
jgi:hypothetical protein